jgi:hypothetical protein
VRIISSANGHFNRLATDHPSTLVVEVRTKAYVVNSYFELTKYYEHVVGIIQSHLELIIHAVHHLHAYYSSPTRGAWYQPALPFYVHDHRR